MQIKRHRTRGRGEGVGWKGDVEIRHNRRWTSWHPEERKSQRKEKEEVKLGNTREDITEEKNVSGRKKDEGSIEGAATPLKGTASLTRVRIKIQKSSHIRKGHL